MIKCKNCGGKSYKSLSSHDYNREISDKIFDYFKCEDCGYLFLDEIPKDLGSYYPADYYGPTPKSADDLLNAAKAIENYKIEIVKDNCSGVNTVLEIGPSMGGFALLCKDAGMNVRTIEMSKTCADFLNQQAEIPTVHSTNEIDSLRAEESVDLLAMWHVIEHLSDPFALLNECFNKVKKDGYLLIAAPNPKAVQFRFFADRWVHLDAPRHVCFLPIEVLTQRMREHGFEPVLATTNDIGSRGWSEFGWDYSEKHMKPGFVKRWFKPIRSFLSSIENLEGRGAAYTIIGKRI